MATKTGADGSEDVNDFLLRIRELGEKRDKEDEERTKKLEEEILQGRQQRRARRAGKENGEGSRSPSLDMPTAITAHFTSTLCSTSVLTYPSICSYCLKKKKFFFCCSQAESIIERNICVPRN